MSRRGAADELRLTAREARRLERAAGSSEARSPLAGWLGFLDSSRSARRQMLRKPGRRGWRVAGTGRVNYIDALPEYKGTTVQVCGLWPFIAGSSDPVVGVPLGKHLMRGTVVCGDPIMWFLANLVTQPSCFVLGRPGLGKSTLIRRMVTVLSAWGIVPMVLSDTKPDYVELVRAMDGQVIPLARGRGRLNVLDFGPIVAELTEITDPAARENALEEMRGRRFTMVSGLLALVLERNLFTFEDNILAEALRILDREHAGVPTLSDLLAVITSRHERLTGLAQDRGDAARYMDRVEHLVDGLTNLGRGGSFGDLFDGETTEHIIPGTPMVFDLSSIDDSDLQLQAAVQSVCWNYGSAVVSAEKHLADAGIRERRHYFLVMDELWRMLRASGLMVYFLDALTRLNRQRGIAQAMITHTMNDLELASEELSTIARGFVERSAMVFLGGLADAEMGNLERVFALSHRERDLITGWSAEGGVNQETGTQAAPPGQGKFLLKVGKKPGTPFQTALTAAEKTVNDTNRAWASTADRFRDNRGRVAELLEEELEAA
ncbi:hypothetical protein [Agromyces sp. NPDC058126]|uniref:hypothetical protein n=1 Tax=Agromyces sp. NPDC058126 TaxID=3346350 RepID=UPI0036D9FBAA